MLKLCLLTLSLDRKWPCDAELRLEKYLYANKWNAEFIFVNHWDHIALSSCAKCPKAGHLAKVAAVAYYAPRCKRLILMDDTMRIKNDAPNLWALPDGVWAATDRPQILREKTSPGSQKRVLHNVCAQLRVSGRQCNRIQFNSGLVVFSSRQIQWPSCSELQCNHNFPCENCDQEIFNALLPHWHELLNVTTVLQGSEIRSDNVAQTTFVHVTRGRSDRIKWLCRQDNILST